MLAGAREDKSRERHVRNLDIRIRASDHPRGSPRADPVEIASTGVRPTATRRSGWDRTGGTVDERLLDRSRDALVLPGSWKHEAHSRSGLSARRPRGGDLWSECARLGRAAGRRLISGLWGRSTTAGKLTISMLVPVAGTWRLFLQMKLGGRIVTRRRTRSRSHRRDPAESRCACSPRPWRWPRASSRRSSRS